MTRLFWLLTIALGSLSSLAQINDNFSDGDFTNNPTWLGNNQHFIINTDMQLQLHSNEAGVAFLCLPTPFTGPLLEWQFYLKLRFAPSNNNFSRIYLLVDNVDTLHTQSDGVYMQFGENMSNDAVELFCSTNGTTTSICRGREGAIADAFECWVKVKYNNGLWEVYTAYSEHTFQLECVGDYVIETEQHGIGVFCQYTASNIDRFYFDDFYYGPPIIDSIPPKIERIEVADNLQQITIQFSEAIDYTSSHLAENYSINNRHYPDSIYYYHDNITKIALQFSELFQEDSLYNIEIKDIKDLNGNVLEHYQGIFKKWFIKKYDVIISEIMAKPTPAVQLPACEYVELYNSNEEDSVILEDWILQTGTTERSMPNVVIPPNEYALLVSENCYPYMESVDNVHYLSSLAITDGGQQVLLKNEKGEVIHNVHFLSTWHTESLKEDGGWSLEMVNLDYPCAGKQNWSSSSSSWGGTPAAPNAPNGIVVELEPFILDKLVVEDSLTLLLFFNYPIYIDTVTSINDIFALSNGLTIDTLFYKSIDNRILALKLSVPLGGGIYRITLQNVEHITSCGDISSASLYNNSALFALPQLPISQDLIINEVLSNPLGSTSARFVEIFNRSDKVIDLKNIKIGVDGDDFPEKATTIISSGYQLFPNNYVAICKDGELTGEQYFVQDKRKLITCDSMPTFSSGEGVLFLVDHSLQVIDRFHYNEEMHYPLLTSTDGVSLERLNPDRETQNVNNWKSAAASVGYGTPAAQNSQYNNDYHEDLFQIIPMVFSPNDDGFDDFTQVFYTTQEPEERITLKVYTLSGELVRILANNQLAATSESFVWDGLTDSETLVPNGMYMVKLQTWDLSGKRKTMKKVVAIYLNN